MNNWRILLTFIPSKKRGYVLLFIALGVVLWNAYSPAVSLSDKMQQLLGFRLQPSASPSPITTDQKVVLGQQTAVPSGIPTDAQKAQLKKIVDGDTIDVILNATKSSTVRLIGINTPEVVDPRRPVQCFGKEASQKAKDLMKKGDIVYLKGDVTQADVDKYNRLLRYVWLSDGTFFNLKMIADGYAYEYTYDIAYLYQNQFKQAQATAQKTKLGLWADSTCKGVQ